MPTLTPNAHCDLLLGNDPDARIIKFIHDNLPAVAESMRERFDYFKDLLEGYTDGQIGYEEFAARVRRRDAGEPEDFDPR